MKTFVPFEGGRGVCHLGQSHELADVFRQKDHITILGHHGNETLQGFQVQVIHLLVSLSFRFILRADWKERDRQRFMSVVLKQMPPKGQRTARHGFRVQGGLVGKCILPT